MNSSADVKQNLDEETNQPLVEQPSGSIVKENEISVTENLNQNSISDQDDKNETLCGIMGYTPQWLQILASKKVYTLMYGLIGTAQLAIGTYYIGTISTVEKRFKMPSFMSGLIASAWDVGSLFACMIMAYFGSRGHKTRWVAVGALVAAISCFLKYTPHAIFGPGDDALTFNLTKAVNYTGDLCESDREIVERCVVESDTFMTFLILGFSQISLGIGTSTYDTLGITYLDDNALKNKVPFLLAVSSGLRMIGPTIGHFIAYHALKTYVEPSIDPLIDENHPRWIGAWWLGWTPLGVVHLVFAFVMALFPKTLPREMQRRKASQNQSLTKTNKSLKDFLDVMKRLIRNPILMFNSLSSTFYIFGMMGYWIFMPKYIENMFRVSASRSVLITGIMGLICSAIGVLVSGAIISKLKPSPRYIAAWNVFTEALDVVGYTIFAFLGCHKEDLHGQFNDQGSWELIVGCNTNCSCSPNTQYSPVCSFDNTTTFFSPCHAGCTTSEMEDGIKVYKNCSCIPELNMARGGACPVDCSHDFTIFLILLCSMMFLSSTGRSGNTIIQFRSVAPEDKAISIALTEVFICAVTFIPAPIVYGMLMDSSCLVWGYECGLRGNCWLYNEQGLRYVVNFTAAAFIFIATLLDIGVLCKVGDLKIYDEEFVQQPRGEKKDDFVNPIKLDMPLLIKSVD